MQPCCKRGSSGGVAGRAGRRVGGGARQKSAMIQSQRHFRLYWSDTCTRRARMGPERACGWRAA